MRPTLRSSAAILAAATVALVAAGPVDLAPTVVLASGDATLVQLEREVTSGFITSQAGDDLQIDYTLFRPAGASASNPVPVVLHSHGWGGAKSSSGFTAWTDEGLAVLSFSQRGFGNSRTNNTGRPADANIEDPDLEAQDVKSVIDFLAGLDWVEKDVDAVGNVIANDPVLGAIGGSYGGGYQWVTALQETKESGSTRFNAIAPEISWYDLPDSLAPSGVVRTAWVSLLYAAGSQTLPDYVDQAFTFGAATGQWPDGTLVGQQQPDGSPIPNLDAELDLHGPSGFVAQGVQLDVPALIRQGASDNLFNLSQGLRNFELTLTDDARADSLFVGFNGGHALPNVAPLGGASGGDPCSAGSASGGWEQLSRDFLRTAFAGGDTAALMSAPYSFATMDGDCTTATSLAATPFALTTTAPVTISSTGAGAAQYLPITSDPLQVAGISQVDATVTSVGVDQRLFFGLAVGTSPLNAQVVQNNLLPHREATPVVQERRTIDLPGVAVDLLEGETLYLVVAPVSDMYAGHGSTRSPGAMVLEDLTVHVSQPVG